MVQALVITAIDGDVKEVHPLWMRRGQIWPEVAPATDVALAVSHWEVKVTRGSSLWLVERGDRGDKDTGSAGFRPAV